MLLLYTFIEHELYTNYAGQDEQLPRLSLTET